MCLRQVAYQTVDAELLRDATNVLSRSAWLQTNSALLQNEPVLNELNITPLLDLAFVLLVIFIITTPQLSNDLEMNLPTYKRIGFGPEPSAILGQRRGVYWKSTKIEASSKMAMAINNSMAPIRYFLHTNSECGRFVRLNHTSTPSSARDQIVKGYEYEEGKYCVLDDADLNQVRTEDSGLIDLIQFVDPKELDLALLDTPYYLTPGGIVARDAYTVVREALRRSGRVGLGQVVLSGRERLVIVKPLGQGLVLHTLRYASELRLATPYFESLADRVDEDQVALAQRLIDNRSAPLDISAYSDRHQAGLLALIRNKTEGCAPWSVSASSPANNIVNLLDALKQSIAQTRRRASAKKAKQAA